MNHKAQSVIKKKKLHYFFLLITNNKLIPIHTIPNPKKLKLTSLKIINDIIPKHIPKAIPLYTIFLILLHLH